MIRIIRDLIPSPPAIGLALDETLLEIGRRRGTTTVRLWVNDRAVVIGRSQSLAAEVDMEEAVRRGIPALRRISGGGAVYHHPGNLNVSVYSGAGQQWGGASTTFARFGKVIAAALRGIGIAAVSSGNMLRLGDMKIGGAAQARHGTGLLYHTTILVYPDAVPMERLLRALHPDYCPSGVPSHPVPTASVSEIIGIPQRLEIIADAVAAELAASLGALPGITTASAEEMQAARELARRKYGDERWNRRY